MIRERERMKVKMYCIIVERKRKSEGREKSRKENKVEVLSRGEREDRQIER